MIAMQLAVAVNLNVSFILDIFVSVFSLEVSQGLVWL